MGMFDYYRPSRPLTCPACGAELRKWQGKDGPCALFIWEQGVPWPIDQDVDDEMRVLPAERHRCRLPKVFVIYSYDCPRHQPIDARCSTENEVWTRTDLQQSDASGTRKT
jgi:hypothetical protein